MTDLPTSERRHLMSLVFAVEAAVRKLVNPDKINLASLGNAVAHLHWHVIPRWHDDSHFPAAIWASPRKAVTQRPAALSINSLHDAIIAVLAEEQGRS
jgi:diadenosine tetraphosphate (Ap4A) HIT family hydrolase